MTLSTEDIQNIKTILKRSPTTVEEHIFDTMWSEHCSYKSSKRVLKQLPTEASTVALGIGEDAGIIRFASINGKQYCIAISHESHNHPSQILPIEGAATGVGGCVRDVYCMGADVIGVLNSLHFGIKSEGSNPLVEEIEEKVVQGVAGYGNPLGVPVLGGETLYHESYNDNCLVNVAAIGLLAEDDIIHSYVPKEANDEPYDVILIGKPTDATGFGGASFSSETLDDENEAFNLGAVQVHDPFLKRVLVEAIKACLKIVKEKKVAIGFKDLGAGGISCATSEIAVGGGFGVCINLDQVNVASDTLPPEVIACSETQERFCMAVPQSFSQDVLAIFNDTYQMPTLHPNAGAAIIGHITKETRYEIRYKGETVCDLPVETITTEVKAHRESVAREIPVKPEPNPTLLQAHTISQIALDLIQNKMNASKRYVYRCYDNAVQGNTVVYPGEADAVVIKPIKESDVGLAVAMDSNLYGKHSPYASGALAVAESIRNLVSVGAEPIALTDCLNYGNPERPSVFFEFEQGVLGIKEAAEQLSFHPSDPIPIISGNVSFYNESAQGNAVIPSPVICAIGRVSSIHNVKTAQFFEAGHHIIVVGERKAQFGGTQIESYLEPKQYSAPQVDYIEEKNQNAAILELYNQQLISSCHDISCGGVWMALVEMCLGERGTSFTGAQCKIDAQDETTFLFAESGGYILATPDLQKAEAFLEKQGVNFVAIGKTIASPEISLQTPSNTLNFDLATLSQAWNLYNPK